MTRTTPGQRTKGRPSAPRRGDPEDVRQAGRLRLTNRRGRSYGLDRFLSWLAGSIAGLALVITVAVIPTQVSDARNTALARSIHDAHRTPVPVLTVRQKVHFSKHSWVVDAEQATYRAADGSIRTARLHGYDESAALDHHTGWNTVYDAAADAAQTPADDPLGPLPPTTVYLSADGRDGLLDSDFQDAYASEFGGFYAGADVVLAVLIGFVTLVLAGRSLLRYSRTWITGRGVLVAPGLYLLGAVAAVGVSVLLGVAFTRNM